MKRKFFVRTLIISLSAMLIFGICSGSLISYFTQKMLKDDMVSMVAIIKDEAERQTDGDFGGLVNFEGFGKRTFRVTFIDKTGEVIADTHGGTFVNHLDRPEVAEALSTGKSGFERRKSESLNTRLMYYAERFTAADGETYVVRLALETSAANAAWLVSIPILVLIAVVLVVALVWSHQKYNSTLLLPLTEIKEQLHTINTGNFKKITVGKENAELLPIINEINGIAENINALNKVRSEFFANASHELNTPLTYISGYAELMEHGMLDDKKKIEECGAKIREQAARMDDLIFNMLKLSKLENSQSDVAFEEVKIKQLIDFVTETLQLQADEKKVKISVYCYEDTVQSNERLLKDILLNLVQNAIKYNKENGTVDIIVKRVKKQIEITVADTGCGIGQEDTARVFERFYRIDKGRSNDSGGTGLGLAIAKHSALKLGGTITLESKLNEGSKFTATFPFRN